eukprot:g9920.t1
MEARVEELEAKVEQLLSRVAQLEAVVGGGGSDAALRPSVGETHHEAPHSPAKTPHAAAAAGSPKASPKKGAKKGVKKGAVSRPPERISKPVEKTGSKKDDGKKDHYFVGTRKIFVERPKALANVMPSAGDPQGTLKMRHVYGYNGRDCRQNAFFLENGKIVFCVAAIGVVMDPVTKEQKFFTGHDEDIQCLAIHPNRRYVATGQRDPKGKATPYTVVWDSETMEKLVKISYHERQVCACSFSGDGTKLFTVGDGDTREAAVWDWQAEKKKNDKPKRMPLQTFVVSKDFVSTEARVERRRATGGTAFWFACAIGDTLFRLDVIGYIYCLFAPLGCMDEEGAEAGPTESLVYFTLHCTEASQGVASAGRRGWE